MTSPEAERGAPVNAFKRALAAGRVQIGLWQALTSPETVEISSRAGFDWLLLDAEHAPNDAAMLRAQLVAMQSGTASAVVRPPLGEPWLIKQILDVGAQTLLVPMIDSAEAAGAAVRAARYPPEGIRGVGAALARASDYGRRSDYLTNANDEICVIAQAESRAALDDLDEIAAVEGIDGVFVGPADLAADMGHRGAPMAEPVQQAIGGAIGRIRNKGKAAGILMADAEAARTYLDLGATFVAVGADVTLFRQAVHTLAAAFK